MAVCDAVIAEEEPRDTGPVSGDEGKGKKSGEGAQEMVCRKASQTGRGASKMGEQTHCTITARKRKRRAKGSRRQIS